MRFGGYSTSFKLSILMFINRQECNDKILINSLRFANCIRNRCDRQKI